VVGTNKPGACCFIMDLQFHSDARAEVNGLPILIYNQGQTVPANIHKIL
tara:strand:- start:1902 stop:2048 length:147 start_codon:yes stop_codon:yes gene_type:complete